MRNATSKNHDSSREACVDPPLAGSFAIVSGTGAGEADLFTLAALCEERLWSKANFVSELAARCAFHFLLRRKSDGALCSFVLAQFVIDELDINKIGTHPDFRRRGCARFLLGHTLQEAKKRGGKRAFLEVRVGNTAAQACYRSIGFHVDSVRRRYYDLKEDALLMSMAL